MSSSHCKLLLEQPEGCFQYAAPIFMLSRPALNLVIPERVLRACLGERASVRLGTYCYGKRGGPCPMSNTRILA